MNDLEQPSRWSQAQLLIAALFTVVLTGENPLDSSAPETTPADAERFTPLLERYPDLLHYYARKQPIAEKCVFHLGTDSYDISRRVRCVNTLTRVPLMPSKIAARVGVPYPHTIPGFRSRPFQDNARKVAAEIGIESMDVKCCCADPTAMDRAWHAVAAELERLRAAKPGGAQ